MPRQELTKTNEEKMVDLDVTGPAVDVELPAEGAVITEVAAETPSQETTEEIRVEEVEEPKKELEDYSRNVQQRINKLTARLREAERREQTATDYAQNVQKENLTLKNRNTALDGNYIIEFANRITTETQAAKAALKQATENDDVDQQVESQQKLARLAVEAQNLKKLNDQRKVRQALVRRSVTDAQRTTQFNQPNEAPPPPDPKAEAWARKNSWFGEDTAMTMTSFVVHRQLTEEEGFDPSSNQYYNEVDKRMREEFPHKFNGASSGTETRPVQTVASATRSPRKGRSKTVRLTPSQVAIAKKLGVPLEEYAKYVKE